MSKITKIKQFLHLESRTNLDDALVELLQMLLWRKARRESALAKNLHYLLEDPRLNKSDKEWVQKSDFKSIEVALQLDAHIAFLDYIKGYWGKEKPFYCDQAKKQGVDGHMYWEAIQYCISEYESAINREKTERSVFSAFLSVSKKAKGTVLVMDANGYGAQAWQWFVWGLGLLYFTMVAALCSSLIAFAMMPLHMAALPMWFVAMTAGISFTTNVMLGKVPTVGLLYQIFIFPWTYWDTMMGKDRNGLWKLGFVFSVAMCALMGFAMYHVFFTAMTAVGLGGIAATIFSISGAGVIVALSYYGFMLSMKRLGKFISGKGKKDAESQNSSVVTFLAILIAAFAGLGTFYGVIIQGAVFSAFLSVNILLLLFVGAVLSSFYIEPLESILKWIYGVVCDVCLFFSSKDTPKHLAARMRLCNLWDYLSWKSAAGSVIILTFVFLNAFGFAILGAAISGLLGLVCVVIGAVDSSAINGGSMRKAGGLRVTSQTKFQKHFVKNDLEKKDSNLSKSEQRSFSNIVKLKKVIEKRLTQHKSPFPIHLYNIEWINPDKVKQSNKAHKPLLDEVLSSDDLQTEMTFANVCSNPEYRANMQQFRLGRAPQQE